MTEIGDQKTLDEAIEWITKAQQLGLYNANVARLARVAADAIRSVLSDEEPKTLNYVREQLANQMFVRMVNKAGSISGDTARTYISRVQRLLRDFEGWTADPRGYRPKLTTRTGGDSRGQAPRRRKGMEQRETASPEAGDDSLMAEHALPLQSGRAYLRLPARLTLEDVRLLMVIIHSHCPDASRDGMVSVPVNDEQVR